MAAHAQEEPQFLLRSGERMPYLIDESSTGLKVMWWNLGCLSKKAITESKRLSAQEKYQINPANQWANLKALVKDENLKPDVLILGEYCPSRFDDSTYRTIKSAYSHVWRLDKSNPEYKIRNGFRVFSKYKIRNKKIDVLKAEDFVDSPNMKSCSAATKKKNSKSFDRLYWNRSEMSFSVQHNEKTYKIVPTHLAQPWSILRACIGAWDTLDAIKNGQDNPNYVQSLKLVTKYAESEKTMLIGDFNSPKSVFGARGNGYYVLSQAFGASVVRSGQATYSDPRRNFSHWSLDHAFVSRDINVEKGVVVPFAGSDHLPIYIVINQ